LLERSSVETVTEAARRRGAKPTFFDVWSRFYDLPPVQWATYWPVHAAVLRALRAQHATSVLDVGCGTGQLTAHIKQELRCARVVGCDFSSGMLGRARERSDAVGWVQRALRKPVMLVGVALLLAGSTLRAMAAGAVSVAGTVKLAGPAPTPAALPVVKHGEVCGKSVADDRLVVGPGGGLRYAVVTIEGVHGGAKPERDLTHMLDNRACRFDPHVQVAEVRQWLELRNSDPILHNADAWIGSEPIFNIGLPPAAVKREPLARPGLVAIHCDVGHTWMNAYVYVGEDPYHTVTDIYGDYEIPAVPPGTYKLRVWHEELGTLEQPLTVTSGKRTTVDVVYPASAMDKVGAAP
jgi:SAM-dependent methyltransferase